MNREVDGLRIHFTKAGQGPPLLVLHGWGKGLWPWFNFQKELTKAGFTVYLFDLPGFGRSDLPPQPWTVSSYVDFVLKFAKSQKLERFFLLGHSFGGRIAIKLAAFHPEKLLGLILCSAAGIRPKRGLRYWVFFFLAKIGRLIFSFPLLTRLGDPARRLLYFLTRERDYYLAKGVMRKTMKKIIAEDLTTFLSSIITPTLIVWGGRDRTVPIKNAYLLEKEIPQARLVIIDEADHLLPLRRSKRLAGTVINFLKEKKPC